VAELVAEMRKLGIPSRRIVLAGFSQGGVVALHLGLRYREPLGGIMALSTYVHDAEHLTDEISLENFDVPIFMAHGVLDPMIPITRAITSREALRALNYRVEWHEYRMGHSVCPQEIADIGRWLKEVLTTTAPR
jgi:phospholipase/carboxylesterase